MSENTGSMIRPIHVRVGTLAPLLSMLLLALALVGCGGGRAEEAFAKIEPQLLSPEEGQVMQNMPRLVRLTWLKIDGASRYQVEVQMQNPRDGLWMPTPIALNRRVVETESVSITFPGSQPGRWRVTAISVKGTRSRASDWRKFEFISGLQKE